MKRFLTILFLTLIIGGAFIQLLYKDKINLIEAIKKPFVMGTKILNARYRTIRFVKDRISPQYIHNSKIGKWTSDPTEYRQLLIQYQIGGKEEKGKFKFRNAIDLEFDNKGDLYVLDKGNKTIEVFDARGNHVRTLGIGKNRERMMLEPTDLALDFRGRVYVSDRRKGILILNPDGILLNSFKVTYRVEQIVVDSQGHIIVLTPSENYLLHKFNFEGRELVAFGEQEEPSKALRQVFNQGILSIDSNDNVYLTYIYPYRIVKYNSEGQTVLFFDRELEILIVPPTIKRGKKGQIKHVFRQKISYDIQIGTDDLIYNLIRTKGAKGGNIIDIYSPEGVYLQSFYLSFNAISFALQQEQLALLSPFKFQRVEIYRIEKMH